MPPWRRVVLAATLLACVDAECRLGFGTDGGGGVFTFGVKVGGESGPLETVAGTAGEGLDQRSALAVDATRGVFLWSEEDPATGRHSVLKKVSAGKATVAVAAAETGRGGARGARNIHGIGLDAATHTAYVSVYDDHGAFRIFSLDYTDDAATPNWEWCGDKRCGVRSDFPSGGVLSAVGGRVYITSSATASRLRKNGGGKLTWFTPDGPRKASQASNGKLADRNKRDAIEPFVGEIGGVVADPNPQEQRVYFVESNSGGEPRATLHETDSDGTYLRRVADALPPFVSWSLELGADVGGSPNFAVLARNVFAASNATHIVELTVSDEPANSTSVPDVLRTRVLYRRPEDDKVCPAFFFLYFHEGWGRCAF
eukprot:Rhum_TRINITY_DN11280_c0_g1::Rhum_TRINITY_DN11280_c0_g1_i4::g.43658::m.43658